MRVFHCGSCHQLVFFENTSCVNCGHRLAFLPSSLDMIALEEAGEGLWKSASPNTQGTVYRLCANDTQEDVCNWAVPADDPDTLCRSCCLNRTIPDLSRPGHREAWARQETAKRRLVYSLLCLKLPLLSKVQDAGRGLAFDFLADPEPGAPGGSPVLTGHADGIITINVNEADDAEREKRRHALHEPYRTLLGHFRHEVGHYYWDQLIRGAAWIDEFRRLFGDEREDYAKALQRHYDQGAPADWPRLFVSAYASSHAWEDWAETWAHYLHITDTLETAVASGLNLRPKRADEPALKPDIALFGRPSPPFDQVIERWFPLTYVLNNLNRGMGLPDAYPFVLSTPAIEKLHFVHEVISKAG